MSSLHVNVRFSHLLWPFHHFWLRKFDSLPIGLLHKLSRQPIDITPQATHSSLKTSHSSSHLDSRLHFHLHVVLCNCALLHDAFNVFQCHLMNLMTLFFNRVQRVALGDWHCKWPRSSWSFWEKHHRPQDTWKIMTNATQNCCSGKIRLKCLHAKKMRWIMMNDMNTIWLYDIWMVSVNWCKWSQCLVVRWAHCCEWVGVVDSHWRWIAS